MTVQNIVGCCDCATGAYPCSGSLCPNLQPYEQIVCDDCGEETDLYEYDGAELCLSCILNSLPLADSVYCERCGDADRIRWFHGKRLCGACIEEKLQENGCYPDI